MQFYATKSENEKVNEGQYTKQRHSSLLPKLCCFINFQIILTYQQQTIIEALLVFICKILYKCGGETGIVIESPHIFWGPSKKGRRTGEIAQGLITHNTFSKDMSSVQHSCKVDNHYMKLQLQGLGYNSISWTLWAGTRMCT